MRILDQVHHTMMHDVRYRPVHDMMTQVWVGEVQGKIMGVVGVQDIGDNLVEVEVFLNDVSFKTEHFVPTDWTAGCVTFLPGKRLRRTVAGSRRGPGRSCSGEGFPHPCL